MKPRSYQEVERHLEKQWAGLHRKQLKEITRNDITSRLTQIKNKSGPIAANRARSSISTLLGWAVGQGYLDTNPVIGSNRPSEERSRSRVLTDDELVRIWATLGDDDYGRIVKLLVLLGQRRDEVGGMRHDELDLDARLWSLPASRTKNSEPHDVPLSDAAIDILRKVPRRDGCPFLFGRGEESSFSGWSRAKAALDARIKAARKVGDESEPVAWRLHDIRRTVTTGMAEIGVLPHVIEAVTNHISGFKAGVAGVYNKATYAAEKRQALDRWGEHVDALVSGKSTNVVPMRA